MNVPLVAVNGLFLDHPRTGTGVYTREMIAGLGVAPTIGTVVIGHPEHRESIGGRYVSCETPLRRCSASGEKLVWEQITLPLTARRLGADLLYAPYFSLPLVTGMPTVVTVHDLVPLMLPEYVPSRRVAAYFKLVAAATRRADAVVTDSESSARDITHTLGIPRERIHVVYLGVDQIYAEAISEDRVREIRTRLDLPPEFILYLGGIDPRKNVLVLLRAAARVREQGRNHLPLVIVSPKGRLPAVWGAGDPRIEAARLGLGAPVVQFLDWIDEHDKPGLYAAASGFVYPSRYEGFGLPPLEAMASGVPVACSSASSLPEVVGDTALLVAPDDVSGWADALLCLSDDTTLRQDLGRRGRARARHFSWSATTSALAGVLRHVLEERSNL